MLLHDTLNLTRSSLFEIRYCFECFVIGLFRMSRAIVFADLVWKDISDDMCTYTRDIVSGIVSSSAKMNAMLVQAGECERRFSLVKDAL